MAFLEGAAMSGRRLLFTLFYACSVFFVACGHAMAQQGVVLERDASLLAAPQNGAAVVAELKQGATGEVLVRKGAWVNVRTAAGTGWLYSFNVRFVTGAAAASRGGADAPAPGRTVAAPRPRGSITATIGIRGLGEEDLRQARFDESQIRLLDQYAASRQDGENAARAAGLTPTRAEYFK